MKKVNQISFLEEKKLRLKIQIEEIKETNRLLSIENEKLKK